MSITDREKEIKDKKKEIETIDFSVKSLEEKLADSHAVRDRLLGIVKHLEETVTNKRGNLLISLISWLFTNFCYY
jgi:hypothetical protein